MCVDAAALRARSRLQVGGKNNFRASRAKAGCGGGVPDFRKQGGHTVPLQRKSSVHTCPALLYDTHPPPCKDAYCIQAVRIPHYALNCTTPSSSPRLHARQEMVPQFQPTYPNKKARVNRRSIYRCPENTCAPGYQRGLGQGPRGARPNTVALPTSQTGSRRSLSTTTCRASSSMPLALAPKMQWKSP